MLLPHESRYISIKDSQDAWHAIRKMQVRGAPAIAIVAVLSLAVECCHHRISAASGHDHQLWLAESVKHLLTSRPTAVNLHEALSRLQQYVGGEKSYENFCHAVKSFATQMHADDIKSNMQIGENGAQWLMSQFDENKNLRVLTHCNTGSLATAGYGTALGVIRSLHAHGRLETVYCTETRPYLQGSRLTAYELLHDQLPNATLITDSMAASIMPRVDAVIVGADRIAANGDTANKIGTLQLAIVAKYHGKWFMVAAPTTTVDQ